MTARVAPNGVNQYLDNSGFPLAGGKVYTYDAGTTTPRTTWTDAAQTTPNANPVILDSAGRATIFWSGTYKVVLKTSADVTVSTIDNVDTTPALDPSQVNAALTQAGVGAALYPRTATEISAGVTPTAYYYEPGDLRRYGLPTDGVSSCTAAFNSAIAVAFAGAFTERMVWRFPRGTFVFATQPNDITGPMIIEGMGRNNTVLVRDYTPGAVSTGLLNFRQGAGGVAPSGSQVNNMVIGSGDSKTGGCLISLVAPSSGDGPDYCSFNNLRLTNSQGLGYTGNGPDYLFYIDGSARSSPLGTRNTWITNSIIFGGALGSAYLKSANGTHFIATDTASAGSVSGKIVLTGIVGNLSNDCMFIGGVIYGMDLDYAKYVRVDTQEMSGSVTNTANTDSVFMVIGKQSIGTVQTNWINSAYQTATGFPNQGQIFNGDVVVGATANIGAAPRHYVKGGGGACYYGEQTVANGYVYNSQAFLNGGSYFHINFIDGSVSHGSISSNGTNTAYNTSSDARLKYEIRDAIGSGAVIDNIRVRSFKWKINDSAQRYGVIAQEIEQVFPECVTVGLDDEATMSVDYSKLVPVLVLEIQSLRKRVSALEGA